MPDIIPVPEVLDRKDRDNSDPWSIKNCAPQRGAPHVIIHENKMVVPVADDERARSLRAHEMMHVKVTPDYRSKSEYWEKASVVDYEILKAVEEFRVNWLIKDLGFELTVADGSETKTGEDVAKADNWTAAVINAMIAAHSDSFKPYLTGIRRWRREWAESLVTLVEQLSRGAKSSHKLGQLASTKPVHGDYGNVGYKWTVQAGLYISDFVQIGEERLAGQDTDEKNEVAENPEEGKRGDSGEEAPVTPEEIKERPGLKIKKYERRNAAWGTPRIGTLPLTRSAVGAMGKRRRASNVGTHPRRITRLLTDPERRVFDIKKKAPGGVLLFDCSGSMRLSTKQVQDVLHAAPGATVICYSAHWRVKDANIWVVAKNGKMVAELPRMGGNNFVDGPALSFAISQRKAGDPLIFITDGYATGKNEEDVMGHRVVNGVEEEVYRDTSGDYENLYLELIQQCINHQVLVFPSAEVGTAALRQITSGQQVEGIIPMHWHSVYKRHKGVPLQGRMP